MFPKILPKFRNIPPCFVTSYMLRPRYLHTSSDLAPVFGLTAAFAAASMIPSSGVLRNISDNTQVTTTVREP